MFRPLELIVVPLLFLTVFTDGELTIHFSSWLENFEPPSQPIGSNTETNCDLLAHILTRLTAIALNSSRFIAPFVSFVIRRSSTLILALRHSIENVSVLRARN